MRYYIKSYCILIYRDMSNSKITTLFTDKIRSFSDDMKVVLKDDTDALNILSTLDAMIGLSPDLVILFFKTHIATPYESEILSRNEAFLRGELHSKFEESTVSAGPLENLHHKIHDRWGTFTDKQKNIIWDYFKILVLLSKRI